MIGNLIESWDMPLLKKEALGNGVKISARSDDFIEMDDAICIMFTKVIHHMCRYVERNDIEYYSSDIEQILLNDMRSWLTELAETEV